MINNKFKNKILMPVMAAIVVAGVGTGILGYTQVASADTLTPSSTVSGQTAHNRQGSGVFGTVTAVNGTTITLTGKNSTTYSVDASNAKITKAPVVAAGTTPTTKPVPVSITVSDIQVGDTLMVRGTVSGTSVTATVIRDGKFNFNRGSMGKGKMPGVGGTVTAINGDSITLTGKNSTAYTVDATNAKISELPAVTTGTTSTTRPALTTITVSDIKIGDTLMVRGTVNGTSVTATNIIDGKFTAHGFGKHGPAAPHVAGTVSAVNGDSVTVTGGTAAAPVVYTVDVTNAKIVQRGSKGTAPVTIAASALTVGEKILVRGTINGTSVTATNVVAGLQVK